MKTTISTICLFTLLAACSSTKWDKAYAKKTCMASMKAAGDTPGTANAEKVCDCLANKMITKYKNEEEANKDTSGVLQISIQCAQESMKP